MERGRGLILGKFMPLHKGHIHLINMGLSHVDELTVVVCTLPTEPIDGQLRYQWVKEQFAWCEWVKVVHYDKAVPQEPDEHPDFWQIWHDLLKEIHPQPINYVFTSEVYGDKLAEILGAEHICVDIGRFEFSVSGTQIRNNPMAWWDMISEPAKPYFVKKVLVYGSESTGKSTLTKQLAECYDTVGVQEFARDYIDCFGSWEYEDLAHFATGHWVAQYQAQQIANQVIFVDSDAITTMIYSLLYFDKLPPKKVMDIIDMQNYDLVLFCQPDVPWVDDGTRDFDGKTLRNLINIMYRDELEKRDIPYVEVHGDWFERYHMAVQAVEKLEGRDF